MHVKGGKGAPGKESNKNQIQVEIKRKQSKAYKGVGDNRAVTSQGCVKGGVFRLAQMCLAMGT